MKPVLILLSAAVALLASNAAAQSGSIPEASANPGRPTVSTPATLITPAGYLQFETGALAANHSPEFSSRSSLNEVMKLSVVPRLEFLASSEPIVHYRADGHTANGGAEYFWELRRRLAPVKAPSPPWPSATSTAPTTAACRSSILAALLTPFCFSPAAT
jgi:hypothetical protein